MKTMYLLFAALFLSLSSFSQDFLGYSFQHFKSKAGSQWQYIENTDGSIDAVSNTSFGKATYHIMSSQVYGYTEEYSDNLSFQNKINAFSSYPKLAEDAWLYVHPKTRNKIFISVKDANANPKQLFYGLAHDDDNVEDLDE